MDIFPSNMDNYGTCLTDEVLPYIIDLYNDEYDGSYVHFQMRAIMAYPNPQDPNITSYETVTFSSGPYRRKKTLILSRKDVPRIYKHLIDELMEDIAIKQHSKTQFTYVKGRDFKIIFYRYWPFTQAGEGYIETPEWLKRKVITIKNGDSNCFIWSVLRALHPSPDKHPSRVTDLKKYVDGNEIDEDEFELTEDIANRITELNQNSRLVIANGINDKSIKQFEIANNLKINLFYLCQKEGDIKPIYLSRNTNNVPDERCINLGLLNKVTENQVLAHYVLIRNLALFFKEGRSYKFCFDCLSILFDDKTLKNHRKYCYNDYCDLEIPKRNKYMVFKHRYRSQRYPFCVYVDFEATSIKRTVTITYKDNDELIFEDVRLPNSIGIFCPELNEKPCFIYDSNPYKLGKKIAIKLKEIRDKAVKIMLHNRETKNIIMTEEEKLDMNR
jgi:hypothetical protein